MLPALTLLMPAAMILGTQGGVRLPPPSWQQGSSVTYSVDPAGSWPEARASSMATISAWAVPGPLCTPRPMTASRLTNTAPTGGLGAVRPAHVAARSRAWAIQALSSVPSSSMPHPFRPRRAGSRTVGQGRRRGKRKPRSVCGRAGAAEDDSGLTATMRQDVGMRPDARVTLRRRRVRPAHSIFSLPDCTVGTGITPVQSVWWTESRAVTAGGEYAQVRDPGLTPPQRSRAS